MFNFLALGIAFLVGAVLALLAAAIIWKRRQSPNSTPMFKNIPDGILVLNKDNLIIDINPAAERMLGAHKSAILNQTLDIVCPKLDFILFSLEPDRHTEMTLENSSSQLFLDISITPLLDNQGVMYGNMIVLRDLTERRKIEQTLRESESKYEALIEQSNEGVLIIKDGKYRFANLTSSEITGYSNSELIGQPITFLVAPEDRQMIISRYALRITGKEVPNVYECKLRRRDGQLIDAEISVGPIIYEGQTAQMVTARDITERKVTQRKVEALYNEERKLRNSLQEEMDKRSKYTRALVHELRTPLTSILASSELLETEIQDKILSALVKNIRRASLNLEQRISELIELARGEVGMLKINPLPFDMTEMVREVVSELTPVAQGKQLVMISEIEDLPVVLGDRSRLRQVVTNILSNAIKFTARGSIKVSAKIYDSESILVQVEDTGRGIDNDQLKHLFDPYRRKVNEGQDLSGMGIGLALSKMFVDLHKSKIWVESQPMVGSVFNFTVPIYHASKVESGMG